MPENEQALKDRLVKAEAELKELQRTLPEHCYGTKGYINRHHASPEHWQMIEEREEEIQEIKAALGQG